MAINLSSPTRVQAFLTGYRQKEAGRGEAALAIIKGLGSLFRKAKGATPSSLAQPAGAGRVAAGKLFPETAMINYGLPLTAGVGTAGASYYYDEDPNKGPIRHALKGLSVGTTLSRPYWRVMRNKIPGVGPEIGSVAGVGTGYGFWNAPSIARWTGDKKEQADRVLGNVEDTSRAASATAQTAEDIAKWTDNKKEQADRVLGNVEDTSRAASAAVRTAEASTGNISDMVGQVQDVTLVKIESALDQLTTTLEQFNGGGGEDVIAVQELKKKLPIIAGALAVTGVGAYAIHKYIGYRLDKAVEKASKDEEAAPALTLARRLRGGEYGTEEREEALKAE